jgi:hypothetical protein
MKWWLFSQNNNFGCLDCLRLAVAFSKLVSSILFKNVSAEQNEVAYIRYLKL